VATDAEGNFVVVWSSFNSVVGSGPQSDIYAQRFDALGNSLGDAFQVNTPGSLAGANPFVENTTIPSLDVDMTSDGDFIIVWSRAVDTEGFVSDIAGQRYDENGNAVDGNFQVDPLDYLMPGNFLEAYQPRVVINEDETFAVAYVASDANETIGEGLLLQRYNADGTKFDVDPIVVTTGEVGFGFGLSGDGAGSYVLVWDEVGFGDDPDLIRATRVGLGSNAPGGISDVEAILPILTAPDVAYAVNDASAIAVWIEGNGSDNVVMGQLYTSDMQLDGGTFEVSQDGVDFFYQSPHVATSPDGDFRVVWVDGTDESVTAATFFAGGILDAPDFVVNSFTFHYNPTNRGLDTSDIAVDSNGNFVIVYSGAFAAPASMSTGYIFARIYRDPSTDRPLNPIDFVSATSVDLSDVAVRLNQRFEELRFPEIRPPRERVSLGLPAFAGPRFEGFRPVFEETFRTVGGVSAIGQISGKVFEDLNGNGVQDPGESGMAGIFLYLDLNKNGRWDEEEPFALSDINGDYIFETLRLDRYLVTQDLEKINVEQTAPAERRANEITLSEAQPKKQEVNFGDKQFTVANPVPFVGPIEPKKTPGSKTPGMTEAKEPKEPTPSKPSSMPPNEE